MKRAKFQILFGGLSLLLFAYLGWCWRPFFIGVDAPPLTQLPDQFRPTAMEELRVAGMLGGEAFSWERATELLTSPYKTTFFPIRVATPGPHLVFVDRDSFSTIVFVRYRTGWVRVPEGQDFPIFEDEVEDEP